MTATVANFVLHLLTISVKCLGPLRKVEKICESVWKYGQIWESVWKYGQIWESVECMRMVEEVL